jgi:hypothetical protein
MSHVSEEKKVVLHGVPLTITITVASGEDGRERDNGVTVTITATPGDPGSGNVGLSGTYTPSGASGNLHIVLEDLTNNNILTSTPVQPDPPASGGNWSRAFTNLTTGNSYAATVTALFNGDSDAKAVKFKMP